MNRSPFFAFHKKDRRWLIVIVIFLVLLWYHRPIDLQGLSDPGDDEFRIESSGLPSAWTTLNDYYSRQDPRKPLAHRIQNISMLDEELAKDRKSFSLSKLGQTGLNKETEFQYFVFDLSGDENIYRIQTLWNNLEKLFAGQTGALVQDEIDVIGTIVKDHDLATDAFDYYSMIPRATTLQSLYRVASKYTATLCKSGTIEQCRANYMILFDVSQKFKRSGAMVSMLIGIVMEDIMIEDLEVLQHDASNDYSPVFTSLGEIVYQDVNEVIDLVKKSEYQALKTIVESLPQDYVFGLYGHTIFDELYGSLRVTSDMSGIGGILSRAKAFHIPLSWFLNVPETLSLARIWYAHDSLSMRGEHDIEKFWPKPAWSRSNIMGYQILKGVLARISGIHQRAHESQERFERLVNKKILTGSEDFNDSVDVSNY